MGLLCAVAIASRTLILFASQSSSYNGINISLHSTHRLRNRSFFLATTRQHELVRFSQSNSNTRESKASSFDYHHGADSDFPTWRYRLVRKYEASNLPEQNTPTSSLSLPDLLMIDSKNFPTKSSVKKACQHEKIVIFRASCERHRNPQHEVMFPFKEEQKEIVDTSIFFRNMPGKDKFSSIFLGRKTTRIFPGDIIAIQTRCDNPKCYPISWTKYLYPPPYLLGITNKIVSMCSKTDNEYPQYPPVVVYQDDHIAIINKPENLSTIHGKEKYSRNDLQCTLPYILQPPDTSNYRNRNEKIRLPLPIHRLDRRTSGLVLAGKTKKATKDLSESFAKRLVTKRYVALTFVDNKDIHESVIGNISDKGNLPLSTLISKHINNGEEWNLIDYPIDGKQAKTYWRALDVSSDLKCTIDGTRYNYTLLLLEVRPCTGRNHQIRRHLSYCLGLPIVGDAKYDRGSSLAKYLRSNGMFLCSNRLEFPYPTGIDVPKTAYCDMHDDSVQDSADKDFKDVLSFTHSTVTLPNSISWKTSISPIKNYAEEGRDTAANDDSPSTVGVDSKIMMHVTIPLPPKFLNQLKMFKKDKK